MSFLKKLAKVAGPPPPPRRHNPFSSQDSQNVCKFFLEDLPAMEAGMLDASAQGDTMYVYKLRMDRYEPCSMKFSSGYTLYEYLLQLIGEDHEKFLKEWFDGIDDVKIVYDKGWNKCDILEPDIDIRFYWTLWSDSESEESEEGESSGVKKLEENENKRE